MNLVAQESQQSNIEEKPKFQIHNSGTLKR